MLYLNNFRSISGNHYSKLTYIRVLNRCRNDTKAVFIIAILQAAFNRPAVYLCDNQIDLKLKTVEQLARTITSTAKLGCPTKAPPSTKRSHVVQNEQPESLGRR